MSKLEEPLSKSEVLKICKFLNSLIESKGLKVHYPYTISFLQEDELRKLNLRDIVEVDEGLYVSSRGLIILRKDFLPNVAIKKLIMGILAITSILNFGKIDMNFVKSLSDELFDKVLVYLYSAT